MGEGEYVILDLVKYLEGKKTLNDIHGIYYRDNGLIKSGKPIQIIKNLDELSFPARHLVEKYDYGSFPGGYSFKKKFTSIETSRGCPYRCRFCARYHNIIKDYSFRAKSPKIIVKEIQEINNKYNSIAIVDDNFLADLKRAHKIFDMLLEIGTELDIIIIGAYVDSANLELYKKMKKANVRLIGYGIESGNQDVLDFYNKKTTLKKIQKAIKLSNEMGFFTFGSFILGAPFETREHIEKTIRFACSLPLDYVTFSPLYYQMGSDLWIEGVKNKKISNNEYMVTADSQRGLANFTMDELDEYSSKAYKRLFLRPNYFLGQLYRAFLHKDFRSLINGWKLVTSLF